MATLVKPDPIAKISGSGGALIEISDVVFESPLASPRDWFLGAQERGNDHTTLDSRHIDGAAWSVGNQVRALIHGAVYFQELHSAVQAMEKGDLLFFTDWRGDADECLAGPGTEVGKVFAAAASRGVDVRGLLWRSHVDRFRFSASENRHLGAVINAAGGQCLLDMRVRPLGSHHQKLVVLRHPTHPERDIAFIGGIDLCHGRRDDHEHLGDPQGQKMAAVYGPRPPWHDAQIAVQGPAVGDAETVFRERWDDAAPLTRNPIHKMGEKLHHEDVIASPLPSQLADPEPQGPHAVQILRTYPLRRPGYPFAPHGERSLARSYKKSLSQAKSLIYIEDQYLWSRDVVRVFAKALSRQPDLRLIIVIPGYPDQDGRTSLPPNFLGRAPAMSMLRKAGGARVAVYSLENSESTPIYVHAKLCVIDDTWACVGSHNANRRSWTHDSELSAAVLHIGVLSSHSWAHQLRVDLAREHLGENAIGANLEEPLQTFELFQKTARNLDAWHATGKSGPRPPGRLRTYTQAPLSLWTRIWAFPIYRLIYDPEGRGWRMRFAKKF